MAVDHFTADGDPVSPADLLVPKARELAGVLASEALPFVTLVECRRLNAQDQVDAIETIVFDVEVERPQNVVNDIRRTERLSVSFRPTDRRFPEVLALRKDFPKVPHLNLRESEFPRSLCLYDESYDELKISWTAVRFVERIRNWLRLTAIGRLHGDDQPLEPLFMFSGTVLVIPPALGSIDETVPDFLYVDTLDRAIGSPFYQVRLPNVTTDSNDPHHRQDLESLGVATAFRCPPQPHGIIHRKPKNLGELCQITAVAELDLLESLRARLRKLHTDGILTSCQKKRLFVIVVFPKQRSSGDPVEISDAWGFLLDKEIEGVGIEIGIWELIDGKIGMLLDQDTARDGADLGLSLLTPMFQFSRKQAAGQNHRTDPVDVRVTAVGMGALGSQMFLNLVRAGFGKWVLIDNDILWPHNLARHALTDRAVGYPKALSLAAIAGTIVADLEVARGMFDDVLKPYTNGTDIDAAFNEADLILDTSASVAVGRHLALDLDSTVRRVCFFLSPSGEDLVMLAEPVDRQTKLDFLEMQYYRHLIHNEQLATHLHTSSAMVRYANSCRDISSVVSQDLVSLHASIGSGALKRILEQSTASIGIWRAAPDSFCVSRVDVPTDRVLSAAAGSWTICWDTYLAEKISQLRKSKLPNETGGVLVGSHDLERRIIYLVDTIPSPPDSKEWPTVYIRGCQGLTRELKRISLATINRLEYVGEWHSHPPGHRCSPSGDDLRAFGWLSDIMATEGLPPLMLIAADSGDLGILVGNGTEVHHVAIIR
ncbi:MAG: ThiF family adenylyltransferase [Thermodesulfobacteriota bacterium]